MRGIGKVAALAAIVACLGGCPTGPFAPPVDGNSSEVTGIPTSTEHTLGYIDGAVAGAVQTVFLLGSSGHLSVDEVGQAREAAHRADAALDLAWAAVRGGGGPKEVEEWIDVAKEALRQIQDLVRKGEERQNASKEEV